MNRLAITFIVGALLLATAFQAQAAPRSYHIDASKYFQDNGSRGGQSLEIR